MMGNNNRGAISPRYLVERHFQRIQNANREGNGGELQPGQQRLRSFLVPGLHNGTHTIDVDQHIKTNSGTSAKLHSSQQFTVDGPKFSLPDGEVQSVYPPQGHEAMSYVLPHMVFNTPDLPWEWDVSADDTSDDFTQNRNRVPWLAVLVFTKEELEMSQDELQQIFGSPPPSQSSTLAVKLPVSQVAELKHTKSPIKVSAASKQTQKDPNIDIILLGTSLFCALFTEYDKNGQPTGGQSRYIRHHRFLAHIRDVNTKGMAVAALDAASDQRSFSVVVSHRTGPFHITEPTTCYVHLVSLRGVEDMGPVSGDDRYIAMPSLYSWSYTCLPPDSLDVVHQFMALGKSCKSLQPNLDPLVGIPPKVIERVQSRLDHGYSLVRYRTQTGEVSAGFMRGAFIPDKPTVSNQDWQLHSKSNTGSDLQILDQQLGLMDLGYSAAWQLGRMLAIADRSFVTSLGRVRKVVYDQGLHYKQLRSLGSHGVKSRLDILQDLPKCIESLKGLPAQLSSQSDNANAFLRRWNRPASQPVDLSYHVQKEINTADKCQDSLDDCLKKAAKEVASAEGSSSTQLIPYNEYNTPVNVDWAVVLRWLLDRLYLVNVPSHYLVTDSSHLPQESIRFFHVDREWQRTLIDGALSLANHFDQEVDCVRNAILSALQWYLETTIAGSKPPVPEYGCYIRSTLISKFPDLHVEISGGSPAQAEDPLMFLRHEIINTDTMICLFAKPPGPKTFTRLSLTQPPHQQSFAAAIELDKHHMKLEYKKAYTARPSCDKDEIQQPIAVFNQQRDNHRPLPTLYQWTSPDDKCEPRALLMDNFSQHYLGVVQGAMDLQSFKDNIASSALMASQLGDPCWRLNIDFNNNSQITSTDVTSANSTAVGIQEGGVPTLSYSVSSMAKPPGSTSPYIEMLGISQDLIFGIQLELQTALSWNLKWIEISIPTGPESNDPSDPKPLMRTYTGQGATMLSNMRFNALVYRDTRTLIVKLLPRTLKGYVPAITSPELSFMLYEVHVTNFKQCTRVPVAIKEYYKEWNTPNPRTHWITLIPPGEDCRKGHLDI